MQYFNIKPIPPITHITAITKAINPKLMLSKYHTAYKPPINITMNTTPKVDQSMYLQVFLNASSDLVSIVTTSSNSIGVLKISITRRFCL